MTATQLRMKQEFLSQHLNDTKRLWAAAASGGLEQSYIKDHLDWCRHEWDRLAAEEPEAAGWRE